MSDSITAIRKLRQALNDAADHPHYIETLAKRGYRFLAPVTEIGAKGGEQDSQPTSGVAIASDISLLTSRVSPSPVQAERGSTQRWIWITTAVFAVAIAVVLFFWWTRPPAVPVVEAVTQLTDDGELKPFFAQTVTHGLRICFNEGAKGSLQIAQVAVTGGSVAVIPTTVASPMIVGLACLYLKAATTLKLASGKFRCLQENRGELALSKARTRVFSGWSHTLRSTR